MFIIVKKLAFVACRFLSLILAFVNTDLQRQIIEKGLPLSLIEIIASCRRDPYQIGRYNFLLRRKILLNIRLTLENRLLWKKSNRCKIKIYFIS